MPLNQPTNQPTKKYIYIYIYTYLRESAFTLFGLNRLPPEQVLMKKILWDLIEGRVPSPTRKNALQIFQQTHWQNDLRPPVTGTDASWILTRAPLAGLRP